MLIKSTFIIIASLTVTPAFAGSSGQHFAQSVDHSAQAASEGSAAAVSTVATVLAVPIIAFGSVITVSGAALEEVGQGSIGLGTDLSRVGTGQHTDNTTLQPDRAPTLD